MAAKKTEAELAARHHPVSSQAQHEGAAFGAEEPAFIEKIVSKITFSEDLP